MLESKKGEDSERFDPARQSPEQMLPSQIGGYDGVVDCDSQNCQQRIRCPLECVCSRESKQCAHNHTTEGYFSVEYRNRDATVLI